MPEIAIDEDGHFGRRNDHVRRALPQKFPVPSKPYSRGAERSEHRLLDISIPIADARHQRLPLHY
jgi:hypothetical protein